jgi:hypothetical protein
MGLPLFKRLHSRPKSFTESLKNRSAMLSDQGQRLFIDPQVYFSFALEKLMNLGFFNAQSEWTRLGSV